MSNSASALKRRNRCQAKAKSGKPCCAAATAGGLCYFHANPKKASELGRKGGRSRKKRQLPSEELLRSSPALDNLTDSGALLDYLIEQVHSGRLDPQRARCIVALLSLRSQMLAGSQYEGEGAAAPPGANFVEVYEAKWLRDKKRRWEEEFEKKYANKFPKRGD